MNELLQKLPSASIATTIALAIAFLPGIAILSGFNSFRRIDWISRICIAPGVSVAIYVLLFSLGYPLGIKFGPVVPWLLCIASAYGLLVHVRNRIGETRIEGQRRLVYISAQARGWWKSTPPDQRLAAGLLVVTCLSILASSINLARNFVVPPGSDSIHHTLIVQLMLDHGGLFESWMPYDETSRFTYHFGFHAITTMYAWMRGMSAEFSVLMMGQIVCALAAIGVIALVRLFTRDLWAALFAAIVAGLVSEIPFIFIDWGRYTQPAGQVLLFTCLVLLATYLRQPRSRGNIPYLILLPVVIAGLGLAHYKVAITFAAFAITLVGYEALRRWHSREQLKDALIASFGRAAIIAGLAILIFSMRGLTVLKGVNGARLSNFVTETATDTQLDKQATTIDAIAFTRTGLNDNELTIWWLACVGVIVILVERRSAIWILLGEVLCWFLMYPQTLGIKRVGILDVGHLRLSVYILLAVLSGLAASWLVKLIIARKQVYQWFLAAGSALLIVVTMVNLPSVPLESTYTTPNDVQLMTWIRTELPSNALLATRGAAWPGGSFAFGVDGGNWLPFYTHHLTNLSNLGTATEKDPSSLAKQRSNALFTEAMYQRDMSTRESATWLAKNGYIYFFLGERPQNLLSDRDVKLAEQIMRNPGMQTIYQKGESRLLIVKTP